MPKRSSRRRSGSGSRARSGGSGRNTPRLGLGSKANRNRRPDRTRRAASTGPGGPPGAFAPPSRQPDHVRSRTPQPNRSGGERLFWGIVGALALANIVTGIAWWQSRQGLDDTAVSTIEFENDERAGSVADGGSDAGVVEQPAAGQPDGAGESPVTNDRASDLSPDADDGTVEDGDGDVTVEDGDGDVTVEGGDRGFGDSIAVTDTTVDTSAPAAVDGPRPPVFGEDVDGDEPGDESPAADDEPAVSDPAADDVVGDDGRDDTTADPADPDTTTDTSETTESGFTISQGMVLEPQGSDRDDPAPGPDPTPTPRRVTAPGDASDTTSNSGTRGTSTEPTATPSRSGDSAASPTTGPAATPTVTPEPRTDPSPTPESRDPDPSPTAESRDPDPTPTAESRDPDPTPTPTGVDPFRASDAMADLVFTSLRADLTGFSVDLPPQLPSEPSAYLYDSGPGAVIDRGDVINGDWDIMDLSTGTVVESTWDLPDPQVIQVGGPAFPTVMSEAIVGNTLGTTLAIIFPEDMADMPDRLEPGTAYLMVLYVGIFDP